MTSPVSSTTAKALHARARVLRAELARRSPDAFMGMVLRDEETGNRVAQGPYHSAWQQVLTNKKRSIVWSHVESGKTQQLSVGRVLWEVGRNPNIRVVIVSNTGMQAAKIVKSIAKYITDSKDFQSVFPDVKPSSPWNQETLVIERETLAKDPTVQAIGMHGNILGARIDLLIMDDVIDYENSRTDYQRQNALHWIESTLFGRLTRHARVVIIGNAWHNEDLMHVLSRRKVWFAKKYPLVDADGVTTWPDRWPQERLDDKREELGPLEFARQMQCEARSEGESRFLQADIDRCLAKGLGRQLVPVMREHPPGTATFTGVDLAVSRKRGAAKTVMFTILVHKDKTREILNIESGRWTAAQIMDKLESTHRRYNSTLIVENNAAQDFLVQLMQEKALPIRPHTTGRNKTHPRYGVESLSAELARNQWIMPSGTSGTDVHPELRTFIDEMLYYDPASHTGDHLMAAWIAREGARKAAGVHRFGTAGLGSSARDTVSGDGLDNQDNSHSPGDQLWSDLRSLID